MADAVVLNVNDLIAGYGKKTVVDRVSLTVAKGEVVAVIGHNGSGKSTLLKAICGLVSKREGRCDIEGEQSGLLLHPESMARKRIVFVPQKHGVFQNLTVDENLEIAGGALSDRRAVEDWRARLFATFPSLQAKRKQRAATMSGGEKQMLALARIFLSSQKLWLLDEPTLGLAPSHVTRVLDRIRDCAYREDGAVLIVEQRVRDVLRIADRVYVLRRGRVSFSGFAGDVDDRVLRNVYI